MKISILIRFLVQRDSIRVLIPVIVLLLSLVISGHIIYAATPTQIQEQKENKRMILLEKLENGQKITGEEIRSGLKHSYESDDLITGFELPEMPDFPEFPGHPDIFVNPPHIYIDPDWVLDEQAVKELKESISKSLGEMKKEIESVIHSEEMLNFHREMKEWGEELRREVEKLMREMKTEKEITVKIEGVRS